VRGGGLGDADGGGGGALEGDAACEVDVERNMEQEEEEEDSLPGDMSEEQWLRTNSDNESDNWTIWYMKYASGISMRCEV
jgi:hypothetical protein